MSEIRQELAAYLNGLKPLKREHPKAGQSQWYYMVPKSGDDNSDYDFVDVAAPDVPTPVQKRKTAAPEQETAWKKLLHNGEYAATAALQGLSLGWEDEIEGVAGGAGYGLASLYPGFNPKGESFWAAVQRGYRQNRDTRRRNLAEGRAQAPILTGAAEITGALASPVTFFKAVKTAPLSVHNRKRLHNALTDAVVYGLGTGQDTLQDYAKNVGINTAGNLVGFYGGNNALGKGVDTWNRPINALKRNFLNQSAGKAIDSTFDLMEDRQQ